MYNSPGHHTHDLRSPCRNPSCALHSVPGSVGYTQIAPQYLTPPPRYSGPYVTPGFEGSVISFQNPVSGNKHSGVTSSSSGLSSSISGLSRSISGFPSSISGLPKASSSSSHQRQEDVWCRQPTNTNSGFEETASSHSFRLFMRPTGGPFLNPSSTPYRNNSTTSACGFGCPPGCGHDTVNDSCLMYPPPEPPAVTETLSSPKHSLHLSQPQESSSEEADNQILVSFK